SAIALPFTRSDATPARVRLSRYLTPQGLMATFDSGGFYSSGMAGSTKYIWTVLLAKPSGVLP
ncbi:MAG: hypothetical protein L0H29_02170, partial [Sinobacteraceae bacterium]|nr:hypothetical protein [Nevskiaceae bacterium]